MAKDEIAGGNAPAPAEPVVIDAAASPSPPSPEAEAFYAEVLRELGRLGIPFLLSGTYAVAAYAGISRPTKDLDIFCKAGDLPRILAGFQALGYGVEIEDERWIGKVRRGAFFFDVIFASSNGTMPVTDQWFDAARQVGPVTAKVCGTATTLRSVRSVMSAGPEPQQDQARSRHRPTMPDGEVSKGAIEAPGAAAL
jgi:hypothetical protein